MRTQTPARRLIRFLMRLIPTPFWTRRYPKINRIENAKKSVMCDTLLKESGNTVFAGPFSTMRLDPTLTLAGDTRMIVGCYEQEVHDIVNEVICAAPSVVVDIGAAFGYYAVGFALKIAAVKVYAFEAIEDPHWSELAHLARINEVSDKIVQRGLCTPQELSVICEKNAFILSDCEGGEEDLLDPKVIPNLLSCQILVELHEFYRPRVMSILVQRFKDTHSIRIVEETTRNPDQFRILKKLPKAWRRIALEEIKWVSDPPPVRTTWLRFMLLTPKTPV